MHLKFYVWVRGKIGLGFLQKAITEYLDLANLNIRCNVEV